MRHRLIFEVAAFLVAVFCAGGWYLQYRYDQLAFIEAEAKAIDDARQIAVQQADIARLNAKADAAKAFATSQIQDLRRQMFEMQISFRHQPTGNFRMHFYPRNNSID